MSPPRPQAAPSQDREYVVTLSLESKATVGSKFFHDGHPTECDGCPLFQICMKNLVTGRQYTVIEVNESVHHRCPRQLFTEDLVVVKVREPPLVLAFGGSMAFPGMRLRFQPRPCPEVSCPHHDKCNPPADTAAAGESFTCVQVIKKVRAECKLGHDVSLIRVRR